MSADMKEGYKRSAAHLDQGLGHLVRKGAFHISYLTTFCYQIEPSNFGDTAQGRALLAGSVLRQTVALCLSLQGAQFSRAERAELFAKGRWGERSLQHLQQTLGYAPTPARHAATDNPTSGGLHLPCAPY
eukprot:5479694-Pleurochrysis_carterae.AAC.1